MKINVLFSLCALFCTFPLLAITTPIEYSADEGESTSTLTTMTQKLKHTFTARSGVSYLIQWTAEIHASTTADYISVCLQLDDTTTYNEQMWHPNPDVGSGWAVASGFVNVGGLSAGSHDFDIDYASSTTGQVVKIRRARIYISEVNI